MSAASASDPTFSHREIVVIILGLMLGLSLTALDQSILATALPRISGELGGGEAISWVVSAYLLSTTAVTTIYGKLSDIFGRKRALQWAIAIFMLGSLLCALSGSMLQLILARVVQGLGGGGLMAMAFATVADIVPPRQRGRYQGYFSAVWGATSILGPVLGGLFADYLDWRWVFWINLPVGLGAWLAAESTLKRLPVRHRRPRIDYFGALLIVAAASCLLLATTLVGQTGSVSAPEIWLAGGAALLLFGLAALQESHTAEPILPPRLFRMPVFVIANLVSMFSFMALIASATFLPMFFQLLYGLSAAESGVVIIPFLLIWTVSSLIVGRTVSRTGRYKIFPILGLGLSSIGAGLLSTVTPETPLAVAVAYTVLLATGCGSVGTVALVSAQNAVQPTDLGIATASFTFSRNLGGAFGVAIFATVLIARLDAGLRESGLATALGPRPGAALLEGGRVLLADAAGAMPADLAVAVTGGFQAMFLTGAAIAALGVLAALFLKELPLRTTLAAPKDAASD